MKNKDLITKLMKLFESQQFANWFSDYGEFGRYISGDMAHQEDLTHEECVKIIREKIAKFLQIKDK